MKKYKIKFEGVTLGAIGKKQKYTLTIEAENWKAASLKMYDTHEHIFILSVNGKPFSYKYPESIPD
jgi:hypothetical protein